MSSFFGTLGGILDRTYNRMEMFSGAIDILVVRSSDGQRPKCSPFHVRFGKLKVLRTREKIVRVRINGELVEGFSLKIGSGGEAFFEHTLDGSTDAAAADPSQPLPAADLQAQYADNQPAQGTGRIALSRSASGDASRAAADHGILMRPTANLQRGPSPQVLPNTGASMGPEVPLSTSGRRSSGTASAGGSSSSPTNTSAASSPTSALSGHIVIRRMSEVQSDPEDNDVPTEPLAISLSAHHASGALSDSESEVIRKQRRMVDPVAGTGSASASSSALPCAPFALQGSSAAGGSLSGRNKGGSPPEDDRVGEGESFFRRFFRRRLPKPAPASEGTLAADATAAKHPVFLLDDPVASLEPPSSLPASSEGAEFFITNLVVEPKPVVVIVDQPPSDGQASISSSVEGILSGPHASDPGTPTSTAAALPSVATTTTTNTTTTTTATATSASTTSAPSPLLPDELQKTRMAAAPEDLFEADLVGPIREVETDAGLEPVARVSAQTVAGMERAKAVADSTAFRRTLVPTPELLELLNEKLHWGSNNVDFEVYSRIQGTQRISARIFVWEEDAQIVVSDVDGTITKSDMLGQILPIFGRDWTHDGISLFYQNIAKNGYKFLYLTTRSIVQAGLTTRLVEKTGLPDGPVLTSPDLILHCLAREVILKTPQEFKIAALRKISDLFPSERKSEVFFAGFGNRVTDQLAYEAVGIPGQKVFLIDPKSQLRIHHSLYDSYAKVNHAVDFMFPPRSRERPIVSSAWNDLHFWKTDFQSVAMQTLQEEILAMGLDRPASTAIPTGKVLSSSSSSSSSPRPGSRSSSSKVPSSPSNAAVAAPSPGPETPTASMSSSFFASLHRPRRESGATSAPTSRTVSGDTGRGTRESNPVGSNRNANGSPTAFSLTAASTASASAADDHDNPRPPDAGSGKTPPRAAGSALSSSLSFLTRHDFIGFGFGPV